MFSRHLFHSFLPVSNMHRAILCLILISLCSLIYASTTNQSTSSVKNISSEVSQPPTFTQSSSNTTVLMGNEVSSSSSTTQTSSQQSSTQQPLPPPPSQSIDSTTLHGINPISFRSVTFLGYQQANNSCSHRDLGFTGKLSGKWYAIYGDTIWAAPGVTNPFNDTPGFHGIVRDSLSEMIPGDPLTVIDLRLNDDDPVPHQLQFMPWVEEWGETNRYGFGGTSICEVEEGVGIVYYLVNANEEGGLIGAGAAKVEMKNDTPTVTQRFGMAGYWWDTNTTARYGDVCAYRDEWSQYIYLWGGPPNYVKFWGEMGYSYLARVKTKDAFDLNGYEYWWGRDLGWRKEVLTVFGPETATLWGTGQGQIFWSKWYECYVMVHTSTFGSTILLRTALSPEGPWTPDVEVFTAVPIDDGLVYAGVAHPYHDESGKTVVLSYTNNNYIEVLKVEFN